MIVHNFERATFLFFGYSTKKVSAKLLLHSQLLTLKFSAYETVFKFNKTF
jgi:hypothetical protein